MAEALNKYTPEGLVKLGGGVAQKKRWRVCSVSLISVSSVGWDWSLGLSLRSDTGLECTHCLFFLRESVPVALMGLTVQCDLLPRGAESICLIQSIRGSFLNRPARGRYPIETMNLNIPRSAPRHERVFRQTLQEQQEYL
jgi:hypothetical protein